MTTMSAGPTLAATLDNIRQRLQSQQHTLEISLGGRDSDAYRRLAVRAELDALWEAVEVLAYLASGVEISRVPVRDYFGERRESGLARLLPISREILRSSAAHRRLAKVRRMGVRNVGRRDHAGSRAAHRRAFTAIEGIEEHLRFSQVFTCLDNSPLSIHVGLTGLSLSVLHSAPPPTTDSSTAGWTQMRMRVRTMRATPI